MVQAEPRNMVQRIHPIVCLGSPWVSWSLDVALPISAAQVLHFEEEVEEGFEEASLLVLRYSTSLSKSFKLI